MARNNSRNQESRKRKKRSVTLLKNKRKSDPLCTIEFDGHNQPVGANQAKFTTYIGVTTRSRISILNPTWTKVEKEEKNQLWLNIKEHWNIEDDTAKTQVLKLCNESWKKFKKKLRNKYMDEGLSPCAKYPYISEEEWENFVQMHGTNEVMEKCLQGKELAKMNKNPSQLVPKGTGMARDNSRNQESQKRKTRGVTLLKDKRKSDPLCTIDFNEHNQPIGANQTKFASYIGVTTRSMISILNPTWKKVEKEEKNQLWLNIKEHWNIEDDTAKNQVLKQCNESWKRFKKILRNKYMDEGLNPCAKYPYLSEEEWEKFVQMHDTDEVLEKRLLGKERGKLNKNPSRLGPKGYRGNIPTWDKEREDVSSATEIHMIDDPRARHYLLGRRMADEHGQLRLPEQLHSIAEQLIDTDAQISQGLLQPEPGTDSLTMVLGPEHPGRTRAVGYTIGLRKGIPNFTEKKRQPRMTGIDFEDRLKEMQAQIDSKFELLREEMKHRQRGEHVGSSCIKKSSVGLIHNFDELADLDEIEEPAMCSLLFPYGQQKISCAAGIIYPTGNGLIHGVPICEGHMKVRIDRIDQRYREMPLPVPTDEFSTLHEAQNTFIQWPRSAVDLSKASKHMVTLA